MNFLQRIKDGAGKASERAQSAVEIGRLNSHISDIQREIEVHYLRMGQVFYESYSKRNTQPAEEEIMELCTACDLLTEEVKELRAKIADLRHEQLCECGARLDAEAESCPHCGRQLATGEKGSAPVSGTVDLDKEPKSKSAPIQPTKPKAQVEESGVEAEAVHDLAGEPGFEVDPTLSKEELLYEPARHVDTDNDWYESESNNAPVYADEVEQEAIQPTPLVPDRVLAEPLYFDEEEQADSEFETKRFELGQTDSHTRHAGDDAYAHTTGEEQDDVHIYVPSSGEASDSDLEETSEQREERQRRELREIRARERRKMNEERERQQSSASGAEPEVSEQEPEPVIDPEYERRQRERIEREKERQDELDRLIASWDRGSDAIDPEERPIRRPSGEVVRCQVCGSGLPKGSKWCPHCASEQI